MAGLNTQFMLTMARTRFCSFQLRLRRVVGSRGGSPVAGRLSFSQRPGPGSPLPCPPALFLAASNDACDIERQRVTSEKTDKYLSRICDGIGEAHAAWRRRVMLRNVAINAVSAVGGTLVGAGLGPDIRQFAPQADSWERSRTDAIATGIGNCWENWQRTVVVPGLPWYPAFAAVPSPVAPPSPNIPTPLVALTQITIFMSQAQMKSQMQANYRGDNEFPNELFDAVAWGLERAFELWRPVQMVTNVLGTGPVPTFAPPYVPVGPVVGGIGNQIQGGWV
jgi:hypothetical protein